jgi:4-amino-4-deoxy-L-arabinose transferase-like glycosyltransferase
MTAVATRPVVPAQPRRPAARTRSWPAVAGAVVTGFALRVAIGLTDHSPSTDETAYLASGISLVTGHGFQRGGHAELHFPPFVPFALGLASRVFPDAHTGQVWLTTLCGTALVVPLFLLARRLGGPSAGVATAWIAAIAPALSTMVVSAYAGSEAEYLLLVATATWLVVSAGDHRGTGRLLRVAGAGACVGLAYLTRPEGLLLAAPLGLAVLLLARRWQAWRTALLLGAAFSVPLVVCIVPYVGYLHAHTGRWELTAKTQDASIEAWHAVARSDRRARDAVLYALDDSGLHFRAGRTSLTALARDDPHGYLAILRTNVSTLGTTLWQPEHGRLLSWVLLPLPVWLLAAYGVWSRRRSVHTYVLLAVLALPVLTALAFFVKPRYLVVPAAVATVFAGLGVAAAPARARRALLLGALALLALAAVQDFRGLAGWGHPTDHPDQRAAGEWLAANAAPGAKVLTRSMVVEYYAERPTVAMPYAELDQMLAFARHYRARYLVADSYTVTRLRPQLAPLRTGQPVPGLTLVHVVHVDRRTTRIFAITPDPVEETNERGPDLGFVGDGVA